MVLFYTSTVLGQPVTIYAGKDKIENEDLIRYAWEEDVWFHVDKLSSPHVYLRVPASLRADALPEKLLQDCAQLVKAGSIEGNKKNNLTIVYCPASNLKKTGDMAIGAVSFHRDKLVKRVFVAERDNAIVNRLNKTKVVRDVDHEAERVVRQQRRDAERRAEAARLDQERRAQERQWQEAKAARDYGALFTEDAMEEERARRRVEGDSDEDFM